jgi:type I restriction enzyme S subunit
MTDWQKAPFTEVIDFQEGPGILAKDFRDGGVPLVRLAGLDAGASVLDGCNYLDPDMVARKWAHFALAEGDILLSTSASLGRVVMVQSEGAGAIAYTGIMRMRPRNQRVFAPFIRYLLASPEFQQQAVAAGAGSVLKHFGPMHLQGMYVHLPLVAEQQKITAVLSALDAKIGLNNSINAELKALAKTIYDYWFVQFDFPDAHGRPYKSSGGTMVWNDTLKREIPAAWSDGALSDIANITMGQSPAGDSYNEDGRGVVFFQGSTDFGSRSPDVRMYTTSPGRMAREGDILVSVRAPVGTLNIADRDCCIGRGLAALNSKNGFDGYLYQVMTEFKQIFDRRSSEGTTFGSITKDDLFGLKVLIPDTHALQAYARMANDWIRVAALRDKENRELARLHDWLLPLLMNGQVRVESLF